MNKLVKFFIICGITLFVGMGLCFGGIMTNGISGIDKVAEKYDWLEGTPGELSTSCAEDLDFDSIRAAGEMDICLIGADYSEVPASWVLPRQVSETIKEYATGEGVVFMCYGNNINPPQYKVKNGVLEINSNIHEEGVVTMNLSYDDGTPKVVVFCGSRDLDEIDVTSTSGDVAMLGVSCGQMNLKTTDGDIFAEAIKSRGLDAETVCGECRIHGDLEGLTKLKNTDGDTYVETGLDEISYYRNVQLTDGTLTVNDIESDDDAFLSYVREGGPNKLEIDSIDGDVNIWFGDATF
ncbi:MAG: DUF4097 family beta strand repeat-containing protein [Lentihominibacter sp.]